MAGKGSVSEIDLERWLLEYARRRDRGDGGRAGADLPLRELRERIATAMAPLVESAARRYRRSAGDLSEDLAQEGYIGLLAALEHWDPSRGVKFSTYATHFVVGAIRHYLRDRTSPIREPSRLTALARRVDSVVSGLSQQLGRAPRPDEVASALDVSEEEVGQALLARGMSSPVSTATLEGDWETADGGLPIAQCVEDRTVLGQALSVLRPREQEVVYEHFFRDLSQSEIARKLGVSANYVSVTLRRSTDRLRRVLSESELLETRVLPATRLVDPETGLYSRSQTHARLLEGISQAVREDGLFGVVAVRLGVVSGVGRVSALTEAGAVLRRSIRRSDIGGRWSTDVLVALLPGTGETSSVVADRLEERLRAVPGLDSGLSTATFWYPEHGDRASDLVGALDGWAGSASAPERKLAA